MLYLTAPATREVRAAMRAGQLGAMMHPRDTKPRRLRGIWFALDNGAFTGFDVDVWLRAVTAWRPYRDRCLFVTAPDVVANATETRRLADVWLPAIAELGYPPAYAAQDGTTEADVPWEQIAVLFVGGSTEWKLSTAATDLVGAARARGIHAHLGRVNSLRRLRYARDVGYLSADGTFITYAPTENLERITVWLDRLAATPNLGV
jgi:hypothetical protein